MIITNNAVAPTMSNVGQTAKATIKASPRLFKFFSDMVYADKFVAILRELVANGVDSHVAAKIDKSVVVTLPTTFTPYLKVRDFGTGMDHDFLMGPFMAYTDASTKENSNEFIGGFGIGSKAPLSYTEQFAIHSYMGGKQRVYSIFKDDEDCPAIAFLSETDTKEPDGVEISFPVEQNDITKFKEAALKALRYFNPLPVLKNTTDKIVPPDYRVKTDSWGFRAGETQSQIVQGGVAYPIDLESVPRSIYEILSFGIDFYVPIGSVGIALSRERLSYDDATVRVLTSLCEGIRPQIQEHVSKMFEGLPTLWEATQEYYNTVKGNTSSGRLIEQLAHYKGEKLKRYIAPVMSDKVLVSFISNSRWNKYGRNSWSSSRANPRSQAWLGDICPGDIQHILIDDGPNKPVLRMRNFLENMNDPNEGVMIVRKRPDRIAMGTEPAFVNDLKWDEFIKALGSPKVIYLSKIEPAVVTRGAGMKRPEKVRAYKAPRRTAEFIDTLPAGGGYYVEMDSFHIVGINTEQIKALDTGGKPLLYFNKRDFELIKENSEWVSAKSKLDEQLKTYKQMHKNAKLAMAFEGLKSNSGFNADRLGVRLIELFAHDTFACPKRGPLAKFNTLLKTAKPDMTDRDRAMRVLCRIDCTKQLSMLKELVIEIGTQYPELKLMLHHNYTNVNLMPIYNKLV